MFPLLFTHVEPRFGFAQATRMLGYILIATSIIPLVVMRFPEPTGPKSAVAGERSTFESVKRWFYSLVDRDALHDIPFVLLVAGALTTFMGIYVMLYYTNLMVAQRTTISVNLASQTLTMVNGASTVGRILPSILADYIGPVQILAMTAFLSGLLTFTSLAVNSAAGLIVWTIAFGSFSGAFMGLPVAGIVSISDSTQSIGKRIGMTLGTIGCGVLVAEPVAGAILNSGGGGWVGLVSWSASLMVGGCGFVVAARIKRVGFKPLRKI